MVSSIELCQVITVINIVFLSSLVSLCGIVANCINLLVFYKQGLNVSINITFFALAVSDLSILVLQQWYIVCVNPWFEKADLLIVPSEFKYLTSGVPRTVFTRITCLITVYITMERCLCIIFPLHVKQMITPRRTVLAMVAIYIVTSFLFAPMYFTAYVGWKFYPHRNKTLLGLVFTEGNDQLTQINFLVLAFTGLALFAGVIIFTCILIRELTKKSSWRMKATADQSRSATMSNKDMKTGKMVALIASILIVSNTPTTAVLMVTFFEPEFTISGRYSHIQLVLFSFGFLLETINSSVNILFYLQMSTKYRETFCNMFACRHKQIISSR